MGEHDDDWNCGLCGKPVPECECGDPLLLVIRIPGLTAAIDDHDLAARSMVEMINDQRHENWVCGGGHIEMDAPARGVRLLASAWLNKGGM
jgi:hypothetical protein